jgi:His/Glu/Gln/Arg/opine family amino acid ABC transporter permease subunit
MVTIAAWLIAGFFSLLVGTILGVLISRRLALRKLSIFIRIYVFIAKGIPAYVHILIAYFVIPALFGFKISGFVAATGALAFCSSGYVAEIIRAGINAIPRGQWDACMVLGYPLYHALRRVMLPQLFKAILPALFGEFEQLLKSTSLLATIGVTELTRTGMNIISRELNPLPVYLMIACIYLFFSAILHVLLIYSERKTIHGNR